MSSRSSSAPSRSRSRSLSSASAVALRSARGASPSYMNEAIQLNSSDCAIGDAPSVSTGTIRMRREWRSTRISRNAGISNTSRMHSREVSSSIGNVGYLEATCNRLWARWRCCHKGVRWPGLRRGRSNARPLISRKRDANIAVPGRWATMSSSTSSGSSISSSIGRCSSDSGRRITMPSSLHTVSTGRSNLVSSLDWRRHGPGSVNLGAERGEHTNPPVADLVTKSLDRQWCDRLEPHQ